jgi:hypothetical protein
VVRRKCLFMFILALRAAWCAISPLPTAAQHLENVIESRGRVFPSVGAGITAVKRDSARRYYVLAKPATVISVYSSVGDLVLQIPNAQSKGVSIHYAVDIDLSPEGRLFVADRGANCILVFGADGSPVARIPVIAPTSIVALSGGEVAVTSLVSKRLVQILDSRGNEIRSFGEPADLVEHPEKQSLINLGKISGDSSGGIYFAFTSVPDRTLRKYDRYGYVGYEASVAEQIFASATERPDDRVQVGFGFSEFSLYNETTGTVMFGSSDDVKFNGGMGTGLGESMHRGYGFGQALQLQTMSQNGSLGGPIGLMGSGQITDQGFSFQPGVGAMSGSRGRGRNRGAGSDTSDQTTAQGNVFQYTAPGVDLSDITDAPDSGDSSSANQTGDQSLSMSGGGIYGGMFGPSVGAPGASGFSPDVLPGAFGTASLFNSFPSEPRVHTGEFAQGSSAGAGIGSGTGAPGFEHPHTGGAVQRGPEPEGHMGFHGRFGSTESSFTGKVRVNLGDLGGGGADKPIITAMATDPETQEVWAAMGETLVRFSKDGELVGIYYPTISGARRLKPVALLVEPDRLLVATDPWGIFEFARPDRPDLAPRRQLNLAPQNNVKQNIVQPNVQQSVQ